MDLFQVIQNVHLAFDQASIPHALIGGLALAAYSIHRTTADVDLMIDEADVLKAKPLLASMGFMLVHESPDVLQFSGAGPLDLLVARRPVSRTLLARANVDPTLGVKVVSIEGLIGLKIQAYSNDPQRRLKDLADIQSLVRSGQTIDFDEVKKYADLFGEWPTIKKLRRGENDLG